MVKHHMHLQVWNEAYICKEKKKKKGGLKKKLF